LFALGASLLFYKFQDLCLFLGAPNPFTTQAIVDLLADRANTADIILRSIITLPLYLFTEILAALVSSLGGPQYRDQIRSRVYLGNNSPSH
jgi:hypothetical protein